MSNYHSSHSYLDADQQDLNLKHILKLDQPLPKVSFFDLFADKTRISQNIFDLLHNNESLWNSQELETLYLGNTNEIYRLIRICLEPKKMHLSNNLYSNLAKEMLRRYPRLLIKVLKEDESEGLNVLLEFLKSEEKLNSTVMGYFGTITNQIFFDFQDILATSLLNNPKQLDLCLKNISYFQIFMLLVNIVFFSQEGNEGWKSSILQHLFTSIFKESKHISPNEFKPIVYNANESLEYITQYNVIKTQEHQRLLAKLFSREFVGSMFDLLCQRFKVDLEYSEQVILLITKISLLHLPPSVEEGVVKEEKPIVKELEGAIEEISHNLGRLVLVVEGCVTHEEGEDDEEGSGRGEGEEKEGEESKRLCTFRKLSNGEKVRGCGTVIISFLSLIHLYLKQARCDVRIPISLLKMSKSLYTFNPWNSILQFQLSRVLSQVILETRSLIDNEEFKAQMRRFIQFLIHSFKNKEYIFLTTSNVIYYGYSESIFALSKLLAEQTYLSQQFQKILHSVPKWEQFIIKDIMNFEKEMSEKKNKNFLEYVKKMSNESIISKEREREREKEKEKGKETVKELDSPTPRSKSTLKVPSQSSPFEYFALYSGSPVADREPRTQVEMEELETME